MSLPSGYKRLEYIQSSGTQYIDTGFKPNHNTRVVADCYLDSAASTMSAFGAWTGTSTNAFIHAGKSDNSACVFFYGTGNTSISVSKTGRHLIDFNMNEASIDGVSASATTQTFYCTYSMFLMAYNSAGSAANKATGKLYSCRIYDNGVMVRDFVPCANSSGTAGLYDLVNAVFYQNAGAGSFTAGPEVLEIPPTPTGFVASFLTETTVQLSWSVSENAAGYKLYKNGVLLSTLTDTIYTDTVQVFSGNLYAVAAYNDDGESAAAELTYCSIPENPILYLVTDRKESDVAYVKLLSGKGLGGMSDAEKAEWLSGLKGAYTASDLNRVESAVDYVAGRLQSFGNAVEVYPKKGWATNDVPTVSTMKRYLNDVAALRAVFAVMPTTPEVPPDMDGLTYTEANNIEQILKDIDLLITNMTASWFYSGDLYAGEV